MGKRRGPELCVRGLTKAAAGREGEPAVTRQHCAEGPNSLYHLQRSHPGTLWMTTQRPFSRTPINQTVIPHPFPHSVTPQRAYPTVVRPVCGCMSGGGLRWLQELTTMLGEPPRAADSWTHMLDSYWGGKAADLKQHVYVKVTTKGPTQLNTKNWTHTHRNSWRNWERR